LSYTRARRINYHATEAVSTAMPRFVPGSANVRAGGPLNIGRFHAYTEVSINNERR